MPLSSELFPLATSNKSMLSSFPPNLLSKVCTNITTRNLRSIIRNILLLKQILRKNPSQHLPRRRRPKRLPIRKKRHQSKKKRRRRKRRPKRKKLQKRRRKNQRRRPRRLLQKKRKKPPRRKKRLVRRPKNPSRARSLVHQRKP